MSQNFKTSTPTKPCQFCSNKEKDVPSIQLFYFSDIDDCASNLCVNGACVDGVNSYTCNCNPGYSGIHCETGESTCCTIKFKINDLLQWVKTISNKLETRRVGPAE